MLWKENDHPRDKDGKFTDKSGTHKEQKTEKVKETKKVDSSNSVKPVSIFNKPSIHSSDLNSGGGNKNINNKKTRWI